MNKRIPLFYLVTMLFWFAMYSYVPILSTYAVELGASAALVGLIGGSYGLTQMLIRIPLGIASDLLKQRKIFILLGILMGLISCLGVFLYPTQYSLLFFRGIAGVSAAAWVIFSVLFTSYFKPSEAPKAIGYITAFNFFGVLCAQISGGFVSEHFGSRYSFLLGAVAAAIGLVLAFGIVDDKDVQKEPLKMKSLLQIGKDRHLLIVSILAIFSQFLFFATALGFTPVLARSLGVTEFQLGLLSMLSSVPGMLFAPLFNTIVLKKFGARAIITTGFVIAALACMATPFANNIYMLYVMQFLGALGSAMVFPLLTGLSIIHFDEQRRATAMGFFQAIYGFGMFFGPVCLGIIGDLFNLTVAFFIISSSGIVGAIIAFVALKKKES